MPKSIAELRSQLSAIEPDESTYEGIGPAEIAALQALLADDEPWLAARAVHALSRIDAEPARKALAGAAESDRMEVRVAAASAATRLAPAAADEVLTKLLADSHPAVRKFAVRAVSPRNSAAVRRQVADLAASESNVAVRALAERQARTVTPR